MTGKNPFNVEISEHVFDALFEDRIKFPEEEQLNDQLNATANRLQDEGQLTTKAYLELEAAFNEREAYLLQRFFVMGFTIARNPELLVLQPLWSAATK